MSLNFEKIVIPSADFHGVSSLPPLAVMSNAQNLQHSYLDEDDEVFFQYGFLQTIFPYRLQDLYDRRLEDREYTAAVLENEYLRAVFLPELGGRLWSLYDKKAGKDLLYANTVIRPCNLALRNAWISGGIEFNCGMVGHSPFTCDKVFMAKTSLADGTPVLRFYEYERIRACVYQMDFFLPEGSPVLYGRMRIVNPNREVVPMYWWTNIAVPEEAGCRMVIPAHGAYTNNAIESSIRKVTAPVHQGRDITYPVNNPVAVDFFWKLSPKARKYMAYYDKKGYGFFQTSTARQRGRKLFVWGQGAGGAQWQEFLTEDGSQRRYAEIQAGLAQTQYECVPMPPNTAWEWLECYGAVQADPQKVHGAWDDAVSETEERISAVVEEAQLEQLLTDTHAMATAPAETVLYGSGWGRLECVRREKQGEKPLCPHLDFGHLGQEQQGWLSLLETGTMPVQPLTKFPQSWMLQGQWTEMLKAAPDSHEKFLHLAAICVAAEQIEEAKKAALRAVSFSRSVGALFVLAQSERLLKNEQGWAEAMLEAQAMCPEDISLARETMAAALAAKRYQDAVRVYEALPLQTAKDGRTSMLYACALVKLGDTAGAEKVLYRDGGLVVEDIREGEEFLSQLYLDVERAKAEQAGRPFDADTVTVPRKFDFRMFVNQKEK